MLRRHFPARLAYHFHPQAAELRARVFRRLALSRVAVPSGTRGPGSPLTSVAESFYSTTREASRKPRREKGRPKHPAMAWRRI